MTRMGTLRWHRKALKMAQDEVSGWVGEMDREVPVIHSSGGAHGVIGLVMFLTKRNRPTKTEEENIAIIKYSGDMDRRTLRNKQIQM